MAVGVRSVGRRRLLLFVLCCWMSKRSRDLGLCVGVRVACCGPPHPNRDRDKDKARSGSGSGGGNGVGCGGGADERAPTAAQQQQQVDLYGVITREGSAANGGWFEVQLDSQPDKKVYYRRGSICKLKQQPHVAAHIHSQHQQQQTTVAAVRAITHSAHPQQPTSGVMAATIATPATLLSSPSSPPDFKFQPQSSAQQPHHSQHLPTATLLLSPSMTHCGEGSAPPLLLQQCVTSPVARPVCTCSLGCTPFLPSAPLSFLSSASARRASTGSVEGSLSLSLAALPSAVSNGGGYSPVGSAACVELLSPPFATSNRSLSTPSRPLLLTSATGSFPSEQSHPSAFTSVVSTVSSTAVLAPRAVRVSGSVLERSTLAPTLHPMSAPVLPSSVAVPAARRPTALGCMSNGPASAAAVHCAPFNEPRLLSVSASMAGGNCAKAASVVCFDAASKRRRLSLEDGESTLLGVMGAPSALSAACSSTACLPAAFVQPTFCHPVALCSL